MPLDINIDADIKTRVLESSKIAAPKYYLISAVRVVEWIFYHTVRPFNPLRTRSPAKPESPFISLRFPQLIPILGVLQISSILRLLYVAQCQKSRHMSTTHPFTTHFPSSDTQPKYVNLHPGGRIRPTSPSRVPHYRQPGRPPEYVPQISENRETTQADQETFNQLKASSDILL